jgi:hypothetical protein
MYAIVRVDNVGLWITLCTCGYAVDNLGVDEQKEQHGRWCTYKLLC